MQYVSGSIVSATFSGHVQFDSDFTIEPGQSGSPIFCEFDEKIYTAGVLDGNFAQPDAAVRNCIHAHFLQWCYGGFEIHKKKYR